MISRLLLAGHAIVCVWFVLGTKRLLTLRQSYERRRNNVQTEQPQQQQQHQRSSNMQGLDFQGVCQNNLQSAGQWRGAGDAKQLYATARAQRDSVKSQTPVVNNVCQNWSVSDRVKVFDIQFLLYFVAISSIIFYYFFNLQLLFIFFICQSSAV